MFGIFTSRRIADLSRALDILRRENSNLYADITILRAERRALQEELRVMVSNKATESHGKIPTKTSKESGRGLGDRSGTNSSSKPYRVVDDTPAFSLGDASGTAGRIPDAVGQTSGHHGRADAGHSHSSGNHHSPSHSFDSGHSHSFDSGGSYDSGGSCGGGGDF